MESVTDAALKSERARAIEAQDESPVSAGTHSNNRKKRSIEAARADSVPRERMSHLNEVQKANAQKTQINNAITRPETISDKPRTENEKIDPIPVSEVRTDSLNKHLKLSPVSKKDKNSGEDNASDHQGDKKNNINGTGYNINNRKEKKITQYKKDNNPQRIDRNIIKQGKENEGDKKNQIMLESAASVKSYQ
ncbi:hypothetical protein CS022_22095, partial [Veronia nyctiphanis]